MKILVTGGLGYIGSHISSLLKESCIIIDNLSNSSLNYNKYLPKSKVIKSNMNLKSLKKIFNTYEIDCVIHLASLKAVNESIYNPLKYYENNFISSLNLLKAMENFKINKLIFSSSCTIYGDSKKYPFKENLPYNPTNPYGNTKMMIEKLIDDYCDSNKNFKAISLRYFNPLGADYKKGLREKPLGKPVNIMPLIINAALNKGKFTIFGSNYKTKDGTCIRDYIHVNDVSQAHIKSLKAINKISGHEKINIGLGRGLSVLELIKLFEKTNKVRVPFIIGNRRKGDIAKVYADNKKAIKLLNWKPKKTYKQMCYDSWMSAKQNSII